MANWSFSDLVEEDWSTSDILGEDWCIPEIKEARDNRDKIEFERERKQPFANLSVAELEQMRKEALKIIAACGLYPEEEIESSEDTKRQMGCKNKNILTDPVTAEKADVGQSSGEGITKETLANPGPDE